MFTIRERFVASDVWMRLWLTGAVGFALFWLFRVLEPSPSAFASPLFLLFTVTAVVATSLLTLLMASFAASAIFDGMTARQALRNGGPFSIGDRVVVIAGRNSGRSGLVTSFGQCRSLRVTLDGEDSEHGSYSDYQLKRTGGAGGEAELPATPDRNS